MSLVTLSIYILGILAILGAFGMLISRHPMRAAMSLLSVMLCLAAMYALLSAPVMAFLQLIIYAGAIMTLIVFIVTLVDVKGEDLHQVFSKAAYFAIPALLVFLVIALVWVATSASNANPITGEFGTIKAISKELLSRYLLHFEAASLLLFVGMIGISTLRGQTETKDSK